MLTAVTVKRLTSFKKEHIIALTDGNTHEVSLFFKIKICNAMKHGSDMSPTHRSDKTRPHRRMFEGEHRKLDVPQIVTRTKIFSNVVDMAKTMCKAILVIIAPVLSAL